MPGARIHGEYEKGSPFERGRVIGIKEADICDRTMLTMKDDV
ncbi:hypothetical protein NPIL_414001, partial [Nephila pilipes]